MPDRLAPQDRSALMSRIRGRNTGPEMKVRRILHRMGYRYRLHDPNLPGKPDLVFKGRKKVIFVNGCFWHGHKDCARSKLPETNREFWEKKIAANVKRDGKVYERLRRAGWDVLVVWECRTRDEEGLRRMLERFLGEGS